MSIFSPRNASEYILHTDEKVSIVGILERDVDTNQYILLPKKIYVKDDKAIETSQIVISGITSSLKNKIQWSLEKI